MIGINVFITAAQDNQIILWEWDINYMKSLLNHKGKFNYEDLIRELTLVMTYKSGTHDDKSTSQSENNL